MAWAQVMPGCQARPKGLANFANYLTEQSHRFGCSLKPLLTASELQLQLQKQATQLHYTKRRGYTLHLTIVCLFVSVTEKSKREYSI